MFEEGKRWKFGRIPSLIVTFVLVFGAFFIAFLSNMPTARAGYVDHTVGNLDILGLTDWGSLAKPIEHAGIPQIVGYFDGISTYFSMAGFMFDQANYNHGNPEGIADYFDSGWGLTRKAVPDFDVTAADTPILFDIDDGTTQKSYTSFTQADNKGTIGVMNDVRIHQTAWTVLNKDWAVIEWRIQNLLGVDVTGVNVAFGAEIADPVLGFGPGGDGNDDGDFWDPMNNIYCVQDNFGSGVTLGFASAIPTKPFNHYYADENLPLQDDISAYNSMIGSNETANPFMVPNTRIATLLSWNGYTIPAGSSKKFAMTIAYGTDLFSMKQAVLDAQDYYRIQTNSVQVTEFQDSSSPAQKIEVYNNGDFPIDMSSWEFQNWAGVPLTGNWIPDADIKPGEYRRLNIASGTLAPEGDILRLFKEPGFLFEEVAYGQFGVAPDPLTGESSSRVWNIPSQSYTNEWTRDSTPTFGDGLAPWLDELNDVIPGNPVPEVVLNEILFNPTLTNDHFVELYYLGAGTLDITNYKIVCDSEYSIGATILNGIDNQFTLRFPTAPGFFTDLTPDGDNVYLYDSNGVLLDMAGWSSFHTQNKSMLRIPDGNGTYDGYDDVSSLAAGWKFDQSPTISGVEIGPDQTKFGDLGNYVFYNMTATNKNPTIDYIEISATTGWDVTFFDAASMNPLPDTNGNGIPDTGLLAPDSSVNITARIAVPATLPLGDYGITFVYGSLYADPFTNAKATLTIQVYPHLEPNKSADPTTIFVEGSGAFGYNDMSTITLEVTGEGVVVPGQTAPSADVLFVIDDTGSMGGEINAVKTHVSYITDRLIENVSDIRFGLVSYKDSPGTHMDIDLTTDVVAFRAAIMALLAQGGGDQREDVEGALTLGRAASWRLGNNTTRIMILIGDAPAHDDILATIIANKAYTEDGIHTNAIATSGTLTLPEAFQWIAENGSGIFRYIPGGNPADPDEFPSAIINDVLLLIPAIDVAGYDPDISDAKPMINEILPSYIHYVPGTFKDPITGLPKNPDNITLYPTNTTLQWQIDKILIDENWSVSFNVTSTQLGWVPVGIYPESRVAYTNWDDYNTSYPFPEVFIRVLSIDIQPPTVYINASKNGRDSILSWIPPPSPDVHHYLIYRSESQTDFDFNTIWADTLNEINPIAGVIAPLDTMWLDSEVTNSSHPNYQKEYYYTIRAVNVGGVKSSTSNTVGYYAMQFEEGLNTFSLPLQPHWDVSLDTLMNDMSATTISWLETNDEWATHPPASPPNAQIGTGYVIEFGAPSSFVFTGEPASMIIYKEGFGFDDATRDTINASVDPSGDVTVSWTPIAGADKYYVFRSDIRHGFFTSNYSVIEVTSPQYQDAGAATSAGELYYLIVPYNSTQGNGSSTYSIGVITTEYNGNEMFGVPLKPIWGAKSADWYVDQIPYCLGIVYLENGIWKAHFKEFKEGVYDTIIEYGRGYELTVYDTSLFVFIGW